LDVETIVQAFDSLGGGKGSDPAADLEERKVGEQALGGRTASVERRF
jgi:hypothetical protein